MATHAYIDKSDEGVLYNQGSGTLGNRLGYPVAVHPRSISAGDLTGDGYPELVLSDWTNNPQEPPLSGKKANVLLNLGAGTFSARHDVEVLSIAAGIWMVTCVPTSSRPTLSTRPSAFS